MTPMIVVHAEREDGKKSLLAFYARHELPLLADRVKAFFRYKLCDRFASVTITLYNPRGNTGILADIVPPAAPLPPTTSPEPVAPTSEESSSQSPLAAYEVLNQPNPN
jgi:hypothetical protein